MNTSLQIGIVGYGKMGQMVESIAKERGHSISFIAQSSDSPWKSADVIIEFSRPESVLNNIETAIESGFPIVTGTTGWHNSIEAVKTMVAEKEGSMLYASNFSLGVNILFDLNQRLASLLNQDQSYSGAIEEIHHTEKLDSPSGTAISLAQGIIESNDQYEDWKEGAGDKPGTLPIDAHRKPNVPGTHIVKWENEIDCISLTHEAKSRKGFALGAVIAAEWLFGKKGLYTMKDVLTH